MTTGVLVMAYGTPGSPERVEEYYTHIRRGRPPTPEQLTDLTTRYDAIGGTSPMAERTRAQVDALASALDAIEPDGFVTALGQKHASPFIEDGVATLVGVGVDRIVGVVLAPHFSAGSVGQYLDRARAAAVEAGVEVTAVENWHLLDELIAFQASSVRNALSTLPERTKVVFTAHSLPQRIVAAGDPYPDQLRATAEAVAAAAGLVNWTRWAIAWQSAGRTPEPWLGPDILQVIDDLAASENHAGHPRGLLVSAVGFVSDHLEVLYDLDIEAAARAQAHGIAFARTACVNDDPTVMAALAQRVIEADQA